MQLMQVLDIQLEEHYFDQIASFVHKCMVLLDHKLCLSLCYNESLPSGPIIKAAIVFKVQLHAKG